MTGNISSPFVGRRRELESLARFAKQASGEFILVYGRRRIGKSFLLQHFIRDRKALFFQASQQTEEIELAAFTEQVQAIGVPLGAVPLPSGMSYPSWESALEALLPVKERLIVILDEFPYLCSANSALPSLLQRWWDRKGRRSNIMLVLCGSSQTVMEQLQAYRSPLFQRFTGRLHVRPLSYREAAEFTPHLCAADKAIVYGILGGTPYNLEQWNEQHSIKENLLHLFSEPTSSLIDSAEYILTADFPDPTVAYRVMQAIVLGKTRFAEIRDFAKIHERALPRLIDLALIERRIPALDDPERSKRSIYVIPDPYFHFYFKFIARNRGIINRGLGASVVKDTILPALSDYMGFAFEEIARAFVLEEMRRGHFRGTNAMSWWSSDGQHEIDIVGTTDTPSGSHEPTLIGTVKWRSQPLNRQVLRNLEEHAAALGADPSIPRLLIGRGGIDPALLRDAKSNALNIHGYSADDLYSEV